MTRQYRVGPATKAILLGVVLAAGLVDYCRAFEEQLDRWDQALLHALNERRAEIGLELLSLDTTMQWQAIENLCWADSDLRYRSGTEWWTCGTNVHNGSRLGPDQFGAVFGRGPAQIAGWWIWAPLEGERPLDWARDVLGYVLGLGPAMPARLLDEQYDGKGFLIDGRRYRSVSIWKKRLSADTWFVAWRLWGRVTDQYPAMVLPVGDEK